MNWNPKQSGVALAGSMPEWLVELIPNTATRAAPSGSSHPRNVAGVA